MSLVPVYGLLAEFDNPTDLLLAARKAHEEGYRKMDGYSPFPVEGLVVLIGGLLGCAGGYLMQWWMSAVSYPINSGGKPYNSWPAFLVVTFEVTILCAALSALFGMLGLNGLPMPYHPLFHSPRFAFATRDRFFLCIEAADPRFDLATTRRFLEGLGGHGVSEVPY
jgi:ActD protein